MLFSGVPPERCGGQEDAFEVQGRCSVLVGNNAPLNEEGILTLPCRDWKLCSHSCGEGSAPSGMGNLETSQLL